MNRAAPRTPPTRPARLEVSILVPVVERVGDLAALHAELVDALAASGRRGEILYVIDDRQRHTLPTLERLPAGGPPVVLLRLGGSFGESAALAVGLREARGERIVTFPSYFQVDTHALGAALDQLDAGADLVIGRRFPRTDSWFNRLQSRLFHLLVRAFTGARFADISCGFRAMRRQVARELQVYGGLHRFIPVLARQRGFAVHELPVRQRPEDRATRYYGVALYVKRVLDLMTVFFLLEFTRRPLRFFGPIGLLLGGAGVAIDLWLVAQRIFGDGGLAERPLLLLGVLLVVLGMQMLSLGLLGEVIIFTHARRVRDYHVAEVIRQPLGRAPRPLPTPGERERPARIAARPALPRHAS